MSPQNYNPLESFFIEKLRKEMLLFVTGTETQIKILITFSLFALSLSWFCIIIWFCFGDQLGMGDSLSSTGNYGNPQTVVDILCRWHSYLPSEESQVE